MLKKPLPVPGILLPKPLAKMPKYVPKCARFLEKGTFQSKVVPGKEEEGIKYKDYFDWTEPVKSAPSHRILAMRRGEKEEIFTWILNQPEDEAIALLERTFIKPGTPHHRRWV
jgi:transcriptional accessory protein Tex/SPT6